MLGPPLFAVYCSPVADIIAHHGVQYHQYADDTQRHLAVHADNASVGCPLSPSVPPTPVSGTCRTVYSSTRTRLVRSSEALIVGTTNQLHAMTPSVSSVSVAGVDLPEVDDVNVLVVLLDRRLTLHKDVSTVAQLCNYHALAIRHIRHLLTTELAPTLACSLILSRIDYCNAVFHGAPNYGIKKLQRVQNIASRVVIQEPR